MSSAGSRRIILLSLIIMVALPTLTVAQGTGTVVVQSNPEHAMVYIDGTFEGETSSAVALQILAVPAGRHTLTVRCEGYMDWQQTITVEAGTSTSVMATLVRPSTTPSPTTVPTTGTISISSSPIGGSVYVDNTYYGITPVSVQVPPGTHTVMVRMEGYQDAATTTEVTAGQSSTVVVSLTPSPAPSQPGFLAATAFLAGAICLVLWGRQH